MKFQSDTKFFADFSLTVFLNGSPSGLYLTLLITRDQASPKIYYTELNVHAFDNSNNEIAVQKVQNEPEWLGDAGSSAGSGANARYMLKLLGEQHLARVDIAWNGHASSFYVPSRR